MSEETSEQPTKTPRTPHARQVEVVRQSIAALERIGHTYATNRQRVFLARLEAERARERRHLS
jgi:hypothetical protein